MVFIGGLDPEYVLDRMEPYEIEVALRGLYMKEKDSWEQTRLIMYVLAQSNTKEKLSPKKLLPFPWDDEEVSEKVEEEDEEYTRWIESEMQKIATEKNKQDGSGFSDKIMAG